MKDDILKIIKLKSGKELLLRRPKEEDAEAMIEYLNIVGGESDNLLFGKNEFRLTVEQEREYISNVNINDNALMILGIIDNQIVSVSQVNSSNRKRIAHNSELAISVKKEYWGMGIGTVVMEVLIDFAKNHDTIRTISLGVKASNKKAQHLYEKIGFEKVGVHRNFFNIDGNYDDEILMDLYID
ncbi:GNAT family protein [Clostridium sp. UBA1056]|uniref:GNAT family N-acetyltransferase n=1 Tax=unclassified Clostridium TaxID=2614128 RepID=UPI003216568F